MPPTTNVAFIKNRRGFFDRHIFGNEAHAGQLTKSGEAVRQIFKQVELESKEVQYEEMSEYRGLVEQEFLQLFAVLKKEKTKQEEFWLYCYYCCLMLQRYYQIYDHPSTNSEKATEYAKHAETIWMRFNEGCQLHYMVSLPDLDKNENKYQDSYILTKETSETEAKLYYINFSGKEQEVHIHDKQVFKENKIVMDLKQKEQSSIYLSAKQIQTLITKNGGHTRYNTEQQNITPDSFFKWFGNTVASDLANLCNTPWHISKIRNTVGFINLCRIYTIFCRITVSQSLLLADEAQWIQQIDTWLGSKTDVAGVVNLLATPKPYLNALSVGLFVVKFIINAGLVLKHTLFPSPEANGVSLGRRFLNELGKRHPDFINDIAWGTVNAVTNYANFFHIAASTAGWLTAGFLLGDACLLLWCRHVAEQEYLAKRKQYQEEKSYYESKATKCDNKLTKLKKGLINTQELLQAAESQLQLARKNQQDNVENIEKQIEEYKKQISQCTKDIDTITNKKLACFEQYKIIDKQVTELDISWEIKNSLYLFKVAAALLVATGFAASMLFSTGVLIVASYAACMVGVAMYLSSDAYNNYKEKEVRLNHVLGNQSMAEYNKASAEYYSARNEFLLTMFKNAVLPSLTITLFAICWPAAIALTVTVMAIQVGRAYSKYIDTHNNNAIPLPPDIQQDPMKGGEEESLDCLCDSKLASLNAAN